MIQKDELLAAISSASPAAKDLLEDHRSFYEELLPHLFFGDLTRYLLKLGRRAGNRDAVADTAADQELRDVLEVLEVGYREGDEYVQELIHVSFLEHIVYQPGEEFIRSRLGPSVREGLRSFDGDFEP